MENKYNRGKIYKLINKKLDEEDIYIGSTCEKYLSGRLAGHVRCYKGYLNGK